MEPVNLLELEALARQRMESDAFDYIAGGAGDEITLRENREAFSRIRLRPRVLVDVSQVDTGTVVLGQGLEFPVLLAPTAFQTLAHPEGERATAAGAARAGVPMVVSTLSAFTLEQIADAAPGPKWFQLYCYRDRGVTRVLVRRALAAGYSAICLTVDAPRLGRRERDLRNRLRLPRHAWPRNFQDMVEFSQTPVRERGSAVAAYAADLLSPSLTWEDVDWLRELVEVPLILKGIMTAEDARLAADHGADAVVVSNHGARQLDGVSATIDVLEEVVEAVDGRMEVLVDGGVRRGTDVVKALALGAQAVLIGRPYVWGLALAGADGVVRVLEMLRSEFELAMALSGCATVPEITRAHVQTERGGPGPPEPPAESEPPPI